MVGQLQKSIVPMLHLSFSPAGARAIFPAFSQTLPYLIAPNAAGDEFDVVHFAL
jgi:hypothetical protein